MKKEKIFSIISIAAAGLIISGCVFSDSGTPGEVAAARPAEPGINIRTVKAERQDLSSRLFLSGDVEASVSVDVYPEAAGKLSELCAGVGDRVWEDQVIARIDPSRPGMKYAESPVRAPISGTVTAVNADPGSTVGAQMPLMTVGDISRLIISAQVPERYVYLVEKGQSALITTASEAGIGYRAKVITLSPVVNPVSRTLEIELGIIGPAPVKAGMFVGIDLETSVSKNCIVVPEKSVIFGDEAAYVYLICDGRAVRTGVSTGITDGGLVEITSGLTDADVVAAGGVSLLSDGVKVRVLDEGGSL